jgi:hypothetical protein
MATGVFTYIDAADETPRSLFNPSGVVNINARFGYEIVNGMRSTVELYLETDARGDPVIVLQPGAPYIPDDDIHSVKFTVG